MSFVVCPYVPFPNLYWWSYAAKVDTILLDNKEHFEKMSFRNRYMISAASGVVLLSIPLQAGRQQRKPMDEILIDNKTAWQKQHWRTLATAYNRSPYFEFYANDLRVLYEQTFTHLIEFSRASIELLQKLLAHKATLLASEDFQKEYPDAYADIRTHFRSNQYVAHAATFPKYQQTFEDRVGFMPNLSMLDALFAEGKHALQFVLPL
jgi:hypothetical protein